MDRPPIRGGAISVAGDRISGVGAARDLFHAHSGARRIDLGPVLLLPGLVNPHVHLELSDCESGTSPGGSFTEWILTIRQRMQLGERSIEAAAASATKHGIAQCLRFGVTTVGDISSHVDATRRVLRDSPIRCVSYGEVLGLGKQRARAEAAIPRAVDPGFASSRLKIGITPHAPYTVDEEIYRRCVAVAREKRLGIATHLAESRDEREFIEHQAGPFRDVWESIGQWQEPVATFRGSPIEFAAAIGLLDVGALLAHVNDCDDRGMDLLSRGRASVVYCPRTHAYFGHPAHRWRQMLGRGINVAIGTDSCASSPDLNIVDDLRLIRKIAPSFSSQSIFEMATIRAAGALHIQDEVGSLTRGKFADFVAFAARSSDPLETILTEDIEPPGVWIAGEPVMS